MDAHVRAGAASGRGASANVSIHAVDGRLLRRLTLGEGGVASWDGRDGSGRDLPAGIYLARLVDEPRSRPLKLVKLR